MNYFVTGIGTDVGKTVVSAVLVEALSADYWKPVQCGFPRDTETVSKLISNQTSVFHPEHYLLQEPASPHQAAYNEGVQLNLADIKAPDTDKDLVIEGAGGIMVPINDHEFILDLIEKFADQVVLVCSLYLGSINHSLLSVEVLGTRGIKVAGIVFNGEINHHSQQIIQSYSDLDCLLHLEPNSKIDSQSIIGWAQTLRKNLGLIS